MGTESAPRPSSTLTMRRASLEDMPIAARIVRSTADMYESIVDDQDMAEHDVDARWAQRNYKIREFYIGSESDPSSDDAPEPVGIVSYQDAGSYAYIGYIYLMDNHIGKGFGRRLIDHVASLAQKRGKAGLMLIAHPEAKWAVRAYEKYGFRAVRTERNQVLAWNDGYLKQFYENGFHLFQYDLPKRAVVAAGRERETEHAATQ